MDDKFRCFIIVGDPRATIQAAMDYAAEHKISEIEITESAVCVGKKPEGKWTVP